MISELEQRVINEASKFVRAKQIAYVSVNHPLTPRSIKELMESIGLVKLSISKTSGSVFLEYSQERQKENRLSIEAQVNYMDFVEGTLLMQYPDAEEINTCITECELNQPIIL